MVEIIIIDYDNSDMDEHDGVVSKIEIEPEMVNFLIDATNYILEHPNIGTGGDGKKFSHNWFENNDTKISKLERQVKELKIHMDEAISYLRRNSQIMAKAELLSALEEGEDNG